MKRFHSFIVILLALVITVVIGLGTPAHAARQSPAVYTSDQLDTLQKYAANVQALGDRLPELGALVEAEDWIHVSNFIRGPFGELRARLSRVTRNLLVKDQEQARQIAKKAAEALESLDRAAQDNNVQAADANYAAFLTLYNNFFSLLPKS